MVSVADEQGRLVLMGVDATYCVVDEVDTTASLHDHYLQQVFMPVTCQILISDPTSCVFCFVVLLPPPPHPHIPPPNSSAIQLSQSANAHQEP